MLVEDLENQYPTVIFHGVSDNCNTSSIQVLKFEIPYMANAFADCVEVGGDDPDRNSIYMTLEEQAEQYCWEINHQRYFSTAEKINIVAFSQGVMIGRYILEKCDLIGKKVHRFLSIGGPNMGINGVVKCDYFSFVCDLLNDAIAALSHLSLF